jgi:predicted phage baseplate assembly protein
VRAASYKVGGGRAGAVDAEALSTLVHSAPFVVGVVNPLPASGGGEAEPLDRSLRRGPREIRARGRAVTAADYELMALSAQGAEVARVHAVSGLHPALGGGPLPGVVGVFVVPPDRGEGPPTADAGTLEAVATHLVDRVAPAGVEVIAAAVRYHRVRAELSLRLRDPSADAGAAIRRTLAEIDRYLHPLTGGDDGEGWPFGAPIRHRPLLRRLLTQVDDLSAIPRLNLVVDGVRLAACADAPISAHGLPWPEGHEAVLERDGGTP